MRVSWSANDFRHARVALFGVSWASCVPHFSVESWLGIVLPGLLHLGLLLSLLVERSRWLARTVAAVLLLPSTIVAVLVVGLVLAGAPERSEPLAATAVVAYALAHAVQLWRLAGLPIPPLHPVAVPMTDDSYHPQTAQGQRAERIAAR